MQLPVHEISMPAILIGKENGKLPDEILDSTPGQAGGPTVRLVGPAARGWRAMCAGAMTAGFTFKATSAADSYRTYQRQVDAFLQRYSDTEIPNRPTRVWQGRTYWLKPGMAPVAVPGTSNHGLGLAVDIGLELDGDAATEPINDAAVSWLCTNAAVYGFSAELQNEPWHWRYWSGDSIPAAVLAFEGAGGRTIAGHDPQMVDLHVLLTARDAEIAQLRTALREVTKALT